jgi:hypothetical protein
MNSVTKTENAGIKSGEMHFIHERKMIVGESR